MPLLRGIEISLVSRPGYTRILEYPHPEGATVVLQKARTSQQGNDVSSRSSSDLYQSQKQSPKTSVYISTKPGSSFAIKYVVDHANTPYLYFKLFVNARLMTAWGIDPKKNASGHVGRSFWSPSGRLKDEPGIEERTFHFVQERPKSVAEDGGLIEVQVFRAKEKRARAPRLAQYRLPEKYGIVAPSTGLLEQPQDVMYFEWHLVDAKDAPYATFRFHYRSESNLKVLNLIPDQDVEVRAPASESSGTRSTLTLVRGRRIMPQHPTTSTSLGGSGSSDASVSKTGNSIEETTAFELFTASLKNDDDEFRTSTPTYMQVRLENAPKLRPMKPFNLSTPQPSKAARDGCGYCFVPRPLPHLPHKDEEYYSVSRRSSVASIVSRTPSVAASLIDYVDGGSFDEDEVQVEVAQTAIRYLNGDAISSTASLQQPKKEACSESETSESEYEASLPSTHGSDTDALLKLSPGHYLPTSGSNLERSLDFFGSPPKRNMQTNGLEKKYSTLLRQKHPDSSPSGIAESEWMRRSPTPFLAEPQGPSRDVWSPPPQRNLNQRNLNEAFGDTVVFETETAAHAGDFHRLENFLQAHDRCSNDLDDCMEFSRGNWI